MENFSLDKIKKNINNPTDKYGVRPLEVLYNENEKKFFCVLEGPDKEAIQKHHDDAGINCDFILEITSIRPETIEGTQRLQVMGELSARVAHDLRNPLGVIKNAIELMEIESDETSNEKTKKRIKMIKNASDRMLRQINDVLDFVRTKPLELENHSLSEILESALKFTLPEGIQIIKPNNDATLRCDGKQLEVVFSNLITNAIQAVENKGQIAIRIKENPSTIVIEVEDSGAGISPENNKKIFDPLFTTKSSGTGLGLVSCKNIVEQHRGTLSFENNPTIFTVELPKR